MCLNLEHFLRHSVDLYLLRRFDEGRLHAYRQAFRVPKSRLSDPGFGQIRIQGSVPRTKGDFNNFIEWIFDMILKVLKIWDVLL